jgi:hypothetical protein
MAVVAATFYDRASADRAIEDLKNAGIDPKNISVVMTNETRGRYFPDDADLHGADVAVAAGGGAAIGGALGAIAGGVLLSGAVIVATGGAAAPFVLAGPLVGALAGGAMGVAVGTLVGALVAAGLSEDEARTIEGDVQRGAVVLVAQVPDADEQRVCEILIRDGGGVTPGTPPPAFSAQRPAEETAATERTARTSVGTPTGVTP